MLGFCVRSLFREYGWEFLRRVAVPHPIKTARALFRANRLDPHGEIVSVMVGPEKREKQRKQFIVGVGFCLKPMDPPCPSGRFNHDCLILGNLSDFRRGILPESCRHCAIRQIGARALQAGAAFYIMTSARDILNDLFVPALENRRLLSGIFVLCRYSFQPFAMGLAASGIHGMLFALDSGDCSDYETWLQADRGVKQERSSVCRQSLKTICSMLRCAAKARREFMGFRKDGNLYIASPI